MNQKEIRKILQKRYQIASGKSNNQIKKIQKRKNITGSIFVATPLVVITVFVFAAFLIAIWLSFFNGELDVTLSDLNYVGWDNWRMLFDESWDLFAQAIKNTLIFAGLTTAFNITGALIITSILNSKSIKWKNIFMTLYFLPQVTSGIAAAIIFIQITDTQTIFGLDLVKNPGDALWVMIIASVWSGISGGLITFNTAFSGIDNSQYESASLDGAGPVRKFWKITVPSLGPILAYTIVMSIIGGMGVFDQAYILSAVGADSSSVMTWALLGYGRIIGIPGTSIAKNVGLGVVTLVLLGLTIFVLTRIANFFSPLDKKY